MGRLRSRAIRAAQMTLLGVLDRRQVHTADGCRSMVEWATAKLDVPPETAKALVATSRRLEAPPTVDATVAEGRISFDRCAAIAAVTDPTDDATAVDASEVLLDVIGHPHRIEPQLLQGYPRVAEFAPPIRTRREQLDTNPHGPLLIATPDDAPEP